MKTDVSTTDRLAQVYQEIERHLPQPVAENISTAREFPTQKNAIGIIPIVVLRRRHHPRFVRSDHLSGRAFQSNCAAVDPENPFAQAANLIHLVTDKYDRPATARDFLHFAKTLLLKLKVADRQYLIDQQDF